MTILHEDELQNNNLAVIRRRKKKIPAWANREFLFFESFREVSIDFHISRGTTGISCYQSDLFSTHFSRRYIR